MMLYLKSVLMHIRCDIEYKVSFILTTLSATLGALLTFLGVLILINKFGSIDGWSVNEIMLTTGIALFGHVATEMFGRGLDQFHKQIKDGSFDRILTRPRNITLQVLCSDFRASKIGKLLEGLVILIYGIVSVDVEWSLYKVFVLLLMIIGSNVLFFSILVLKASFSFWTIEGMELMNIISDGGRELSSYPISIYQKWFANIFTYIIPFGCVNYFPLIYLLDKGDVSFWYGLTPLMTFIFMLASFGIWNIGLKQYASTGS